MKVTEDQLGEQEEVKVCDSCKTESARTYIAVTPNGFMTDFIVDKPASDATYDNAVSSFVASPSIGEQEEDKKGRAILAFSRQGRIYKVSQRGDGAAFEFERKHKLPPTPNHQWLDAGEEHLWRMTESGDGVRVKLTAAKTTDLLSIRLIDARGLAFFDNDSEVVSRKAAWYSAATIVQRAIALELDVDSVSIEIASVHKYTNGEEQHGAELYLADEHPNGAGLVDWAKANWEPLLEGCVLGIGDFSKLGRYIQEECKRAIGAQDWRTPDTLLKGFRNRQLHGLIDWRLGLELLSVIRDPSYVPGISPSFETWGSGLQDWGAEASDLAEQYCSAISTTSPEPFSSIDGKLHGWVTEKYGKRSAYIVSHPLWEFDPLGRDDVSKEIISLVVTGQNAQSVTLLDSFNLTRRMSWVRGNLTSFFREHPLDAPGTIIHEGGGLGVIEETALGSDFELEGAMWTRVEEAAPWDQKSGRWVMVDGGLDGGQTPFVTRVKEIGPNIVIRHKGGQLKRESVPNLKLVAKASNQGGNDA